MNKYDPIDIKELSAIIKAHPYTICGWVRNEGFPATRTGHRNNFIFIPDVVMEWLKVHSELKYGTRWKKYHFRIDRHYKNGG